MSAANGSMGPPATQGSPSKRIISIHDYRRNKPHTYFKVSIKDSSWEDLYQFVIDKKKIARGMFSLTLPGRVPLTEEKYKELTNGSIVWLLDHLEQRLQQTVSTSIRFDPHYHTITQSGMYEYYDSRGIDSLVISLAELIDNSLSATKDNKKLRHIEIRYYDNASDSMVVILDNGHGMNISGLTDWARFKYSKFERKNRLSDASQTLFASDSETSFSSQDLPLRRSRHSAPVPSVPPEERKRRYLDSDINYFGAGGKQAIFNIGQHTTMLSTTADSVDTFEITLSKNKFEEKAKNSPEDVFQENVLSRTKGTERNLTEEVISECILNEVIEEMEELYKSFTICCIKDLTDKHRDKLNSGINKREDPNFWTKQLARIYHYYLHGPKGNVVGPKQIPSDLQGIRMMVQVFKVDKVDRANLEYEKLLSYSVNLKDIDNDLESLLVRTAADNLEFEVEHMSVPNTVIEGIVRYHPYLHNKETLPHLIFDDELSDTSSNYSARTGQGDEAQINSELQKITASKSKTREVFECFWHGRLIPQDCIDFEWSKPSHKSKDKVDDDCFGRLSGALFTNCAFQVSQNKQSFMDLSKLLGQRDHLTFYKLSKDDPTRRLRTNFETDFYNWLKECHKKHDKQVVYKKFERTAERNEFPALKKNSLSQMYMIFNEVQWKDKTYKKGDLIQTQKTKPMGLIGRVDKFLVPATGRRDNSSNYMGPPGLVEILQMPEEVYGKGEDASKIITFKQWNADSTTDTINEELAKTMAKLPHKIQVTFPRGNAIVPGRQMKAGELLPDMQVILFNSNGDRLDNPTIPHKNGRKNLRVQMDILRVELNEGGGEERIQSDVSYPDHAPFVRYPDQPQDNGYWFLKPEDGIKVAGKYRLTCVCLNYTNKNDDFMSSFANGALLPRAKDIDFTVVAAEAHRFMILDTNLKTPIGEPFSITLEFYDKYNNKAKPSEEWRPVLMIDNLKVDYTQLKIADDKFTLQDVTITGIIQESTEVVLEIMIESLNKKQEVKVYLKKGPPAKIRLISDGTPEFVNGTVPDLAIQLFDRGGNEVTFDQNILVFCKLIETDNRKSLKTMIEEQLMNRNIVDNKNVMTVSKPFQVKRNEETFDSRKFFVRFYIKTMPSVQLERDVVIKPSESDTMPVETTPRPPRLTPETTPSPRMESAAATPRLDPPLRSRSETTRSRAQPQTRKPQDPGISRLEQEFNIRRQQRLNALRNEPQLNTRTDCSMNSTPNLRGDSRSRTEVTPNVRSESTSRPEPTPPRSRHDSLRNSVEEDRDDELMRLAREARDCLTRIERDTQSSRECLARVEKDTQSLRECVDLMFTRINGNRSPDRRSERRQRSSSSRSDDEPIHSKRQRH